MLINKIIHRFLFLTYCEYLSQISSKEKKKGFIFVKKYIVAISRFLSFKMSIFDNFI